MGAFSKEKEAEYVAMIRTLLVRRADMSPQNIKDTLTKQGIVLDRWYISKLVKKIEVARTHVINRRLDVEIGKYEEMLATLADRLWDIILSPQTGARDRTGAIREMRQARESLLDKQFDAGFFERQLGKVKVERTLTDDQKTLVKTALEYVLKPIE